VAARDDAGVRLARELMAGRLEAFDEFVDVFRTRVFQYSFLMCGQRDDAEEVAQDTLLKAFENFSTLREPEHVRSWIFRIAKNVCLMKRRRSIFAPAQEVSLEQYMDATGIDGGSYQRQMADAGDTPEAEAYRQEMNAALAAALQTLPSSYRSVILLRDIEELSTEETAGILEVSADVVKQRLHRGRMALRKAMDERLTAALEGSKDG
jgi:RNA polymerase sigma-70 factor (ECF subfamily)